MVFHNLWKEKMAVCEKKAKKSENTRGFFDILWKTMLEVWIKIQKFFHIILWKNKITHKFPFLVIYGNIDWNFDDIF